MALLKHFKRRQRLILLLALISAIPLQAQPVLTLEDCLYLARKQGLEYKTLQRNLALSYEALRMAQAPFNLQANLSLNLPQYSESNSLSSSIAFTQRIREENVNLSYEGTVRFSQHVPHFGTIGLTTSGGRREFTSSRRTSFVDFSGDIALDYRLDLLRRDPAVVNLERAKRTFNQERLKFQLDELLFESHITESYYNLVEAVRSFAIQEKNYNQSKASLELAQKKYEIGLIAEVEALRLQVDLLSAEAGWSEAQVAIERSRDAFRELLGLDLNKPFEIVTDLEEISFKRYSINLDKALTLGQQRNISLQVAKITQDLSEIQFTETQRNQNMTAQLQASATFLGRGDQFSDISESFERNRVQAGIVLGVPLIDNGTRHASLRRSELLLDQSRLTLAAQERQLIRQIKSAVYEVQQADRQIDIFEAALAVAERTYQVEQSRFDLGLVDSQFLLTAQANVTRAHLNALNAVLKYKRALVNLRVVTNTPPADLSTAEGTE